MFGVNTFSETPFSSLGAGIGGYIAFTVSTQSVFAAILSSQPVFSILLNAQSVFSFVLSSRP
jgi:hypothetical protein